MAAFYCRRGRELRERHVWERSFVQDPSAIDVVDEDPIRVQIDVRLDGETLPATVDESGRVSAVDR